MNKTSQAASHLGKLGGKKSAEKRFSGKTKEEISAIMRKARLSPDQKKKAGQMAQEMVDNLNKNVSAE